MKKINIAVIISIIPHVFFLFVILPLNNNFIEEKVDPYQYISINAVLLNNQPEEEPFKSITEENPIINKQETEQENFLVANISDTEDTELENGSGENTNDTIITTNTETTYEYYPLSMVQIKPSLIEKPDFIFPRAARRNDITEATVVVELLLNEQGEVMNCTIIEEAGYGFDEATIEVFEGARFTPAYIDGKPVPVIVRIPIHWKLED